MFSDGVDKKFVGFLLVLLCATAASAQEPKPDVRLFENQSNIPPQISWPPPPPYNRTVKVLGNFSSATQCRTACIQYTNQQVSPVSGWSRCQSFTWLPDGICVVIVDPGQWQLTAVIGAITGRILWHSGTCVRDSDCSYNGACSQDGSCICDSAWEGDRCQTLALRPTTRTAGLRAVDDGRNTSTWGGATLLDRETGVFHMWASEMLHHCGIESWTTNSHVVHAVSKDGISFHRVSETLTHFAHEPNVVRRLTTHYL